MAEIISAEFDAFGGITVVIENQPPNTVITVPVDEFNRDYQQVMEWAQRTGKQIREYQAPPPPPPEPTVADLMAKIAELERKVNNGNKPSTE